VYTKRKQKLRERERGMQIHNRKEDEAKHRGKKKTKDKK
jgi:hypothetical protein